MFPYDARLPKDFNFGSLFRNDVTVNRVFKKYVHGRPKKVILIKSHLTPDDVANALESDSLSEETRYLIDYIWKHARKIYVYRDARDVMVSLYHHQGYAGSFSDFLREKNTYHNFGFTRAGRFEENKPLFWKYHISTWKNASGNTAFVQYERLNKQFEAECSGVLQTLGLSAPAPPRKPRKGKTALDALKEWLNRFGLNLQVESTHIQSTVHRRGSWELYFNDEDISFLKEQAGDVMQDMGYAI